MTTIAALVTDNWPVTEANLQTGDNAVSDLANIKLRAIERSSYDLYKAAPPVEDDIPQIAKQWIADKATVYLIPVAIDFYATHKRKSDSLQNMTVTYYDRVAQLKDLRAELEAACRENLDAALNAIDAADAPDEVASAPAVSVSGLLVDPTSRAYLRGPY